MLKSVCMSQHRLFVAIELPDGVKNKILALCEGLPGVRWVKRGALHLTLKFIGNLDEAKLKKVKAALEGVSGKPFSMTVSAVGCFSSRGRARVLWVGVDPSEELITLQKQVDETLAATGITQPEPRPFLPHITLSRLKNWHVKRLKAYLEKHKEFKTNAFPVEAFHLFSSRLTPDGAIHKIEKSFVLKEQP